jgi:hypothetical protein
MGRRISGLANYAIVERVLARVHGIDEAGLGAFRGRIQRLQKLGLAPERPGKGKHIAYTNDHVCVWAFALQLSELGVAPNIIAALALRYENWTAILWGFAADEEPKGDRFVVLDSHLLAAGDPTVRLAFRAPERRVPDPGDPQLSDVLAKMFPTRAIVINASDLRRRINDAVDEVRAEIRAFANHGERRKKRSNRQLTREN